MDRPAVVVPDFARYTIAQLRQYARENGMSSITRLNRKDDLISAIKKFKSLK